MSTTSTEVKAAVSQEAAKLSGDAAKAASQVQAKAALDISSLKQRVTSLELDAKTWYEKHVPLVLGIAGLVAGFLIGRIV